MITKQTKFITSIAGVLFLSVGVALVVTLYIIFAKGDQLQTQLALLADVSAQQQRAEEVQRILSDSAPDREALQTLFLTEADTIDFLATIEQAASRQGITLTTESLKVEEPKDKPATLLVDFTFAGPPQSVRQFITFLETIPYGSYLTNLQLQTDRETGTAEAKVTIAILLLPDYD